MAIGRPARILPVAPGIASIAKYQYPYTPLGAGLFRVKAGGFEAADLTGGAFAQFADAKTLQLRNTHFVTREVERAQPGDLLFYRQDSEHMPFHSMIYLGASQIERARERYLVYHTGPDGGGPGEIRRPTLEELRRFPDADWRPLPGQSAIPRRLPLEHSEEDHMKLLRVLLLLMLAAPGLSQSEDEPYFSLSTNRTFAATGGKKPRYR